MVLSKALTCLDKLWQVKEALKDAISKATPLHVTDAWRKAKVVAKRTNSGNELL